MRSLAAWAVVLAAVGVFMAWPVVSSARAAEPDAAEPDVARPAPAQPAAPPPPSPQELAVRKAEKLINSTRDKMNDFQKAEFQLEMASIVSEGAALQAVKDPKKATEQIAKNAAAPGLGAYRSVVLSAAREWLGFQQRYSIIGLTVKTLQAERANAPANLRTTIDELAVKFNQKNLALQMKVIGLYEKAADYRDALAVATSAYQNIAEEDRAGAQNLKQKIADLCLKVGDASVALAAYKSILDAKPEADRYKDASLCEKLGDAYKATGDLKNALDMYKHALPAAPKDAKSAKAKAVSALQKKIDDIEKKLKPTAPAAPAAKAAKTAK